MRQCGGCTLCCKLLPVRELAKGANERCAYQRTGKGCAAYRTTAVPMSCRLWSCRWLTGDDTADMRRPDHVHYVVDIMPDIITIEVPGAPIQLPVIQVWVDHRYPDAHQDADLRAYLARRGEQDRMAALIRLNSSDGFVLFPPALTPTGDWIEHRSTIPGPQTSPEALLQMGVSIC